MSTGPVVVAILSHRDPPLLRRLIKRVHEGRNTVALLHHDPRGVPHGLTPSDRTLIVPDPTPCDWGRMSLAQCTLRLLDETRRRVPDFSWLLLISGQDYPAQSLRRTEDELATSESDAYVRWFPISSDPSDDFHSWQKLCRARYLHSIRIPGSPRSAPWPRFSPFHDGLQLYIGDMWVNLRSSAVDHVLGQRERLPQVERYLSRCSIPDEALLPTLLLNNAHLLKIIGNRKRYIHWVKGASPQLLGLEDLPALSASDDFFARKFDSRLAPEMLDRLDELADQRQTNLLGRELTVHKMNPGPRAMSTIN